VTGPGRLAALATTGVVIVAAALLGWSVFVEPGRLLVLSTPVVSSRWPAGPPPLRIAVLTDLHVGSFRNGLDHLEAVVSRTNDQGPDLVVLLGDFVIRGGAGGSFVPPEPIAKRLAGLRARYGLAAVLGNHDWWFDGPRVRAALAHAGIRVLENEAIPQPGHRHQHHPRPLPRAAGDLARDPVRRLSPAVRAGGRPGPASVPPRTRRPASSSACAGPPPP
jgi:predicted MPP superfamily phosphohydrolase